MSDALCLWCGLAVPPQPRAQSFCSPACRAAHDQWVRDQAVEAVAALHRKRARNPCNAADFDEARRIFSDLHDRLNK
ncbi:MAG TPA: hypothetical protein VK558_02095 [Patescibacteria group bacterium]|nr:hypothetical protein [Patescibacteria group bacterium]